MVSYWIVTSSQPHRVTDLRTNYGTFTVTDYSIPGRKGSQPKASEKLSSQF